jgi:hypothetical protein
MMMECTQFQRLVQIIDIRIIPLAATSSNEILPTSYIVEINHMYFAYSLSVIGIYQIYSTNFMK